VRRSCRIYGLDGALLGQGLSTRGRRRVPQHTLPAADEHVLIAGARCWGILLLSVICVGVDVPDRVNRC
jgi:hypothetical protein